MQRSVWSNYCKVMWIELISQLTTETLWYTNLTWVYLGATSGAKTSVFCHYFLGQLDSLFTMALMKQLSCISQEAIYREIKVIFPVKLDFPRSLISREVTFHGKSFSWEVTFAGSHIYWEVTFPRKLYFLGSHNFQEVLFPYSTVGKKKKYLWRYVKQETKKAIISPFIPLEMYMYSVFESFEDYAAQE